MIPFAGYDPTENVRRPPLAQAAYGLFKNLGLDTKEIADRLNISEAKALRLISTERSLLNGLPNPYGVE